MIDWLPDPGPLRVALKRPPYEVALLWAQREPPTPDATLYRYDPASYPRYAWTVRRNP